MNNFLYLLEIHTNDGLPYMWEGVILWDVPVICTLSLDVAEASI